MKKRFLISRIAVFLIGILFIVMGILGNEQFYGMGICVLLIGALKAVQQYRIIKDGEKFKEYETKYNDERNRYIAEKAYAGAFWISIYGEFAAECILLYLKNDMGVFLSYLICAQVIIYLILRVVYNRKY